MSESIKPFADHGHYTAVHDAVFDVVMPFCPPNAFKVLMFVLRKTRGWKKEEDVLSYSQVKAGTGIKSDATLSKELDWLLDKKLLLVREATGEERTKGNRKAPAYSINREFSLNVTTSETGVEPSRATSENEAVATSENEETRTRHSQEPETSSLTNVREEGESDKSPVPAGGFGSAKRVHEVHKVEEPEGKPEVLRGKSAGQYAVAFLADRLKEAKARGATPPPLTNRQRGEYGEFFAQSMADGDSVEDGETALLWLAAKACGDIPHEHPAWAYYGSGQRAVRDGWRPKASLHVVEDPEARRKNDEEWDEIIAEQEAMIREAMGG